MARPNESPGTRLRSAWLRLSPLPGGRWLFSRLLGHMVPYSGTIGAHVELFEPGEVRITLADRRKVRNHLRSFHAIALANLGELSTGLALLGAMGEDIRGILTGLDVTYRKKARGPLEAHVEIEIPEVTESIEHTVVADIRDAAGDVVATVAARWRLSPVPTR
ncbi:MAG: hotdog fold domain-containing protein [Longimicrobiales bacterium]|nr:hotdog fold domain-containing protein [Longimicrobiales bacterium]